MGRPLVVNGKIVSPEEKRALQDALVRDVAAGTPGYQACQKLGLVYDTVMRWHINDPRSSR